jgi:hypothetical protein
VHLDMDGVEDKQSTITCSRQLGRQGNLSEDDLGRLTTWTWTLRDREVQWNESD